MSDSTRKPADPPASSDHEIIHPPNKLRAALSFISDKAFEDPVARAERALAELSSEFSGWMASECERLDQARSRVRHDGVLTMATREALFHAAHDIKGQAATFGFPLVAAPAASLCRLLDHTPDLKRIPLSLIDQHVDAVRAIIRESARPHLDKLAEALTMKLRAVTDEFLVYENRERPGYLDSVLGPALVPGDPA